MADTQTNQDSDFQIIKKSLKNIFKKHIGPINNFSFIFKIIFISLIFFYFDNCNIFLYGISLYCIIRYDTHIKLEEYEAYKLIKNTKIS